MNEEIRGSYFVYTFVHDGLGFLKAWEDALNFASISLIFIVMSIMNSPMAPVGATFSHPTPDQVKSIHVSIA